MQRSIIIAIIKAFKIVPIPGFCLRGIHKIKTVKLIKKVIRPIDKLTFIEIPWAKTLHGDAPELETIRSPSPKPKITSPKQRKNNDENFGLRFKGFCELQNTLGIFLILRNIFNVVFTICLY